MRLSDILSIQKVDEIQSSLFDDMKKYGDDMALNNLYSFLIQLYVIDCESLIYRFHLIIVPDSVLPN